MNQDQNMSKLPLPPEIIVHISRYLNIKDKVNLRLINKSFKFVFDNLIIIDCLTIKSVFEDICTNWFYTNKSANKNNLIEFSCTNTINNLFKNQDQLSRNIRKLFIALFSINLNTINQLKNLEELNIDGHLAVDSNHPILSLPKLKILSIKQYFSRAKIELETPLLSFLRCEDLENYQFNYAEKLIYLDSKFMYSYNGISSIEIEKLRNLEYFISYGFGGKNELKPNLLTKLNYLKELHLNNTYYEDEEEEKKDLNKLKELYQYKLKLKLDNLKIFLYGIDYDYLKQLNQDQLLTCPYFDRMLELIFENYSKTIDILPFVKEMDFNKLSVFLNDNSDISLDDIARKFPNVRRIYGSKLNEENIDCLFEFISILYDNFGYLQLTTKDNKNHHLSKSPNLYQRIRILSGFDID